MDYIFVKTPWIFTFGYFCTFWPIQTYWDIFPKKKQFPYLFLLCESFTYANQKKWWPISGILLCERSNKRTEEQSQIHMTLSLTWVSNNVSQCGLEQSTKYFQESCHSEILG